MHSRHVIPSSLILAAALLSGAAYSADGLATIKGRVYGPDGPLTGARVFLEPSLDGPLTVVETDATGHYVLENVVPALVGVFAHAPGLAVDGRGVQLALDQSLDRFDIRLGKPGTLSGSVMDDSDRPVPDARVTRAVILGTSRVGIPFSKLGPYGISEPSTDSRGQFAITSLPQGAEVGLKVAHPSYAQGLVASARVGGRAVSVALSPGILLSGTVLARGREVPVGNASIEFRNVEPPYDTVLTYSRGDGSYIVRLRPATWVYQASGNTFQSPNLQRITLDPKYPAQTMPLYVAGTSTVRGFVKDAKSGAPVANAHVLLSTLGVPAATTTTGPTGAYEFTATEGDNVVQLGMAPGFFLPPEPAYRVSVTAGTPTDLPTFWVVGLPTYSLEVVDANEEPVAGAIVRVLEPAQFGWYEADENGLVELSFATLPADGRVVGSVEHPQRREGAVFAISRERSDDAIVQLQLLTTVTGRVTNEKDSGIEGAVVEASTMLDGAGGIVTLWRTTSGSGGRWSWPAAVPHVALALQASAVDETGVVTGQSAPVTTLPGDSAPKKTDALVLPGVKSQRAALDTKYEWRKLPVICGSLSADPTNATVIVHAPVNQYTVFADGLANVSRVLRRQDVSVAIVVNGDVDCGESNVLTLRGNAPSRGTVYLVNARSEVVFEGFDLPPVAAILDAAGSAGR